MKAKTPEEEVEPLADPEPDIPPAIDEPDEDEPDEKAARGDVPIFVPKQRPVLKEIIETRAGIDHFDVSGPHHS